MSQDSLTKAAIGCSRDVTAAHSDSAREAAARLADKYAALANALRGSNSDVADHLSQLRQDLESCLAGLQPQSTSDVQQQPTLQCHNQQHQISHPNSPRTETAQYVVVTQAIHSTASPQYSNSSTGGNKSNSQQQQQQQQRQQPNQVLDSPESQQTLELVPAFSERNCLLPTEQAALHQPLNSTQQQQQQQQSPRLPQQRGSQGGGPTPGATATTSAGTAAAGDGSAAQQQGISSMKSSYRGLTWDKKDQRWRVRVHYLGKQHHVGRFADEIEAARHFDSAAFYLFGDKAITNFGTDAARAHNGPVPASIRALLPLHGTEWQQCGAVQQQQQQNGSSSALMNEAGGSGAGVLPLAGPAAAAAAAAAAAGGGQRSSDARKKQPYQFRQLSMHLVQPSAVGPQPNNTAAPVADSGQQQTLQQAASHNEFSSSHYQQHHQHQQRQYQQRHSRSPPLMLNPAVLVAHHPQQQQQQGFLPPPKREPVLSGIPEWLNKQVKLTRDLGEPAFKAARFTDGNAGLRNSHHHHQQQQQHIHALHAAVVDAAEASTVAAAGVVKAADFSVLGQLQRVFGQQANPAAVVHEQQQEQQQPGNSFEGKVSEQDINGLEQQLIPKLLRLKEQLQKRAGRSRALSSHQVGPAMQKRYHMLRQLQQNIQELQQVLQTEDDAEQQRQQLAAAQASESDLLRGLMAGGMMGDVPADQLAALVAALLGVPAPGAGGAVSAAGNLAGRKRSAPEMPQQVTPAADIAAAAAAAAAAVERDMQVQGSGGGGGAVTLSALAAVIAAIQQAAGSGATAAPAAAAVGGGGALSSRMVGNAATASAMGAEEYGAFFPG